MRSDLDDFTGFWRKSCVSKCACTLALKSHIGCPRNNSLVYKSINVCAAHLPAPGLQQLWVPLVVPPSPAAFFMHFGREESFNEEGKPRQDNSSSNRRSYGAQGVDWRKAIGQERQALPASFLDLLRKLPCISRAAYPSGRNLFDIKNQQHPNCNTFMDPKVSYLGSPLRPMYTPCRHMDIWGMDGQKTIRPGLRERRRPRWPTCAGHPCSGALWSLPWQFWLSSCESNTIL